MKKLIIAFLLTGFSFIAFSQTKKLVVHSSIGVSFPSIDDLDNELRAAGLLENPSAYFARGGGIYNIFANRLTTLTSFNSYSGVKEENGRSSAVRGTQVGTSLGYAVVNNEGFHLIPYVGLAYAFFGVRSASNSPAANIGFSNYLSGSSNQHHVSSDRWAGNVGVHLAKEGIGETKLLQKLVLGARAGYFIPLGESKWKTNDTKLSGGPDVNSGGFNLSFVIGFIQ